jgi:predicted DNA-binding transcriptional regulator AlpA
MPPSARARLRSVDVARYLGVSQQRVSQMVAEGKLPKSQRGHRGPSWTAAAIERWAERGWWETRPWRIRRTG